MIVPSAPPKPEAEPLTGEGSIAEPYEGRIRLLDPLTVNQIAAGEVVERPAAALKELVENSLDAGSTRIDIELVDAGRTRIRISDNGCGMTEAEARMSLMRHATSKISRLEDLQTVASLGFRGEAVPSIASVSRMQLSTAPEDGARSVLRIEGGTLVALEKKPGPKGTEIVVEDLFYNTPARLKFLKSDTTEVGQALDHVTRYAFAYPGVAFSLSHNGQVALRTSGSGDMLNAISEVWGREVARALTPVDMTIGGLRIVGVVSPPHITKPNRTYQFLYVNMRPVRTRTLTVALDQAFRDITPDRRFPMVCLNIEVDPERVDVNVSPTKSDVKFQHEGSAFEGLRIAIRQALMDHGMMPSAAQIAVVNQALASSQPAVGSPEFQKSAAAWQGYNAIRESATSASIFAQSPLPTDPNQASTVVDQGQGLLLSEPVGGLDPFSVGRNAAMPYIHLLDDLRIIGQAQNTFIIAETKHGIVLVDQHVAHERILYEYLCGLKSSTAIEKQRLLVPQTLHVDRRAAMMLAEKMDEISSVGFELEPFGGESFLIRAIPAAIRGKDPVRMLRDMVDELIEAAVTRKLVPTREAIWIMSSCKMAVKAGDPLSHAEMEKLMVDLATTENPYHCPHGRPITVTLSTDELLRLFKRIH